MDNCDNFVFNPKANKETLEDLNNDAQNMSIALKPKFFEKTLDSFLSLHGNTETIMGQTESKNKIVKNKRNQHDTELIHTKGTAMSFGFRKKLSSTPKKFKKMLGTSEDKNKKDSKFCNKSSIYIEKFTETTSDAKSKHEFYNTEALQNIHFRKIGDLSANFGELKTNLKENIIKTTVEKNIENLGNQTNEQESKKSRDGNRIIENRLGRISIDCGTKKGRYGFQEKQINTINKMENDEITAKNVGIHSENNLNLHSKNDQSDNETILKQNNSQLKSLKFNLKQNTTIEYQCRHFFEHVKCKNIESKKRNTFGLNKNSTERATAKATKPTYTKYTLQTVNLPKPEFPLSISLNAATPTSLPMVTTANSKSKSNSSFHLVNLQKQFNHEDQKNVKQMVNNSTRYGLVNSREMSVDSGIASIGVESSGSNKNSVDLQKGSRNRPRNLKLVMSGRHTFKIRDLDDSISSETNSFVETLELPNLPADNRQTLPLFGLVQSDDIVRRYKNTLPEPDNQTLRSGKNRGKMLRGYHSFKEEKLDLVGPISEKHEHKENYSCLSKCSSESSWYNTVESLAAEDLSSMSLGSIEINSHSNAPFDEFGNKCTQISQCLSEDDLSLSGNLQNNKNSAFSDTYDLEHKQFQEDNVNTSKTVLHNSIVCKSELSNSINTFQEKNFADIAFASSNHLIDDETSPTDSFVSSTKSEKIVKKQFSKINSNKENINLEESTNLEGTSPISPGTPTHTSQSLSLSDCGNLIDDEIADQPALLFNNNSSNNVDINNASLKDKKDIPTFIDIVEGSKHFSENQIKSQAILHLALERKVPTPSVSKDTLGRSELLDSISPCESICSDDLMMNFDTSSSLDSLDRSPTNKSHNGSKLNNIDNLERHRTKGKNVVKDINSIILCSKIRTSYNQDTTSNIPARAARLLNRSRLEDQLYDLDQNHQFTNIASKSVTSVKKHQQIKEISNSSDELMLHDRSMRNAMIQDVVFFKKQLIRLRKVLQEADTLNPFQNDIIPVVSLGCAESQDERGNKYTNQSFSNFNYQLSEIIDLRRQVAYLQSQVDDQDRTIRLQKDLIEKLETRTTACYMFNEKSLKKYVNSSTQTERSRPLSIAADSLSRSKHEQKSFTDYFVPLGNNQTSILSIRQLYPNENCKVLKTMQRQTTESIALNKCDLVNPQETNLTTAKSFEKKIAQIALNSESITNATDTLKLVKTTSIGEPDHCQSLYDKDVQNSDQKRIKSSCTNELSPYCCNKSFVMIKTSFVETNKLPFEYNLKTKTECNSKSIVTIV